MEEGGGIGEKGGLEKRGDWRKEGRGEKGEEEKRGKRRKGANDFRFAMLFFVEIEHLSLGLFGLDLELRLWALEKD